MIYIEIRCSQNNSMRCAAVTGDWDASITVGDSGKEAREGMKELFAFSRKQGWRLWKKHGWICPACKPPRAKESKSDVKD